MSSPIPRRLLGAGATLVIVAAVFAATRFRPLHRFVPQVEFLRLFLFVFAVAGVYLLAAGFLAQRLLRRIRAERRRPGKAVVRIEGATYALALFGLACMVYGFVEPYRPEITHLRIATPKLPQGGRPVRLVHLSDLHCDPAPRLEERLPDLVAGEHPDLIVFTGDALNAEEGLPILRACLSRLAKIAPTFVVKGNWDAWYWRHLDLFGGTGVRELNGDAVRVETGGGAVWVAGAAVQGESGIPRALEGIPSGAFGIFLYHYPDPDVIPEDRTGRADLFCCGHTHGGQIALPGYGAIVTLAPHGKRYEAGLYDLGGRWMYVNRGIGMEGGLAPRVRFLARPEVTVIEIVPDGN